MAYMIDGKGPYPNKAGEFCGNHHPGLDTYPSVSLQETPAEAQRRHQERLARMRFGKPSSCGMGTSEEMAAKGYVGLYLKEDSDFIRTSQVQIETDELTEEFVSMKQ